MIARIQIPKGWRRLRAGEIIAKGDMHLSYNSSPDGDNWFTWDKLRGRFSFPVGKSWPYIRRVKRRRAKLSGYIELTLEQWDEHRFPADSDEWLYQSKEGGELLTWSEWMARRDLGNDNTRFWLRRGAK